MGRKKLDISVEDVVRYIVDNHCSIREAAKYFHCSKDVIFNRLKEYNGNNKEEIVEILQDNLKNSRF